MNYALAFTKVKYFDEEGAYLKNIKVYLPLLLWHSTLKHPDSTPVDEVYQLVVNLNEAMEDLESLIQALYQLVLTTNSLWDSTIALLRLFV